MLINSGVFDKQQRLPPIAEAPTPALPRRQGREASTATEKGIVCSGFFCQVAVGVFMEDACHEGLVGDPFFQGAFLDQFQVFA